MLPDKPYGGFYLPKGKAAFIMRMGRRAAGGGMMLDQLDQQVQQRRLQFCFLAGNPLGVIQADNFPEESRGPLAVYNGGKVKGRTVYIGSFAELHIEDHGIIRQFGFCAGVMDLVGVDDGQTVFYQIVSLAADEHISPTGSAKLDFEVFMPVRACDAGMAFSAYPAINHARGIFQIFPAFILLVYIVSGVHAYHSLIAAR